MRDFLISLFSDFPGPVAVFLLGAIPISEIRGALPVGLLSYDLSWFVTYPLAVLGNLLPIFPLYAFLFTLKDFLFRIWPALGSLFDRWLTRAHHKVKGKYDAYGAMGLFFFVAIPFPLTGVYTATAAAILLEIPLKKALPALALGVLTSGLIVTFLVLLGVTALS